MPTMIKGENPIDATLRICTNMSKQQYVFTKRNIMLNRRILSRNVFAVIALIGKRLKPFSDGEFVKEYIITVVYIHCLSRQSYRPSAPFLYEAASHVKKTAIPAIIINLQSFPLIRHKAIGLLLYVHSHNKKSWQSNIVRK